MKGLDIFQRSIDAMVNKPFEVDIETNEEYEGDVLDKIVISDLKVGTVFRLQPLVANLPMDDYVSEKDQMEAIGKCKKQMLEILCIGIWNKEGNYPTWWHKFFMYNFTFKEWYIFYRAIMSRLHSEDFINSITMTRRMVTLVTEKQLKLGSIRCQP